MKHIKLFESFDRYEFVEYNNDNKTQMELEVIFVYIKNSMVSMTEIESSLILSISSEISLANMEGRVFISLDKYTYIYSLGDYIFAYVLFSNDFDIFKIIILDEIDEVIEEIKKEFI